MKLFFGTLSGLIALSAALPYILAIYRGRVRPHRFTWLIWLLAKSLIFATQYEEAARWSLTLSAVGVVAAGIVFVLSLKRGVGGTSIYDWAALSLSLLSLGAWIATQDALYGLFFAIAADAIGTILTVGKTYRLRGTESTLAWGMAAVASFLSLLAVEAYTIGQTAFPLYAFLGGLSIFAVSLLKLKEE
jgi:hypothetical protein